MNEFLGTTPWSRITQDVKRKGRSPIVAAIAYIGSDAKDVLPLREGDFLICDASQRAIKQGVTNARSLAALHRRGVRIFSHEGLHAKVIVCGEFAWVGSANASKHSRDELTEASVRVVGTAVRTAMKWALSLATEDTELSGGDIRQLQQIPVSWAAKGGQPTRLKLAMEFPHDLAQLRIVEFPFEATSSAVKIAEVQKAELKRTLHITGSSLDWFQRTKSWESWRAGDWFIDVTRRRVRRPARVIRVSKQPSFDVVWFQELKTSNRIGIRALEEVVGDLSESFDRRKIRDKTAIHEIRRLYGLV